MPLIVRPVKFPRPPRLQPIGVTFEPALTLEPSAWFAIRVNGAPPASGENKSFKFQQAITAKP